MANPEQSASMVRTSVVPHLCIKGATEAIDFYVKAFGAKVLFQLPGSDGRLMHGCLGIGNSHVYLCDEFSEARGTAPGTLGGTPVTLHLNVDDVDAAYAQALAAGAEALSPPADMFWGDRYGQLVDPFGHRWSLASPIEQISPGEIAKRLKECEPQTA